MTLVVKRLSRWRLATKSLTLSPTLSNLIRPSLVVAERLAGFSQGYRLQSPDYYKLENCTLLLLSQILQKFAFSGESFLRNMFLDLKMFRSASSYLMAGSELENVKLQQNGQSCNKLRKFTRPRSGYKDYIGNIL